MNESKPPRHAALELFGRYRSVWQAAWAKRGELAGPARFADEAAFLPAALSLQETPVHPAPRRAAWVICTLFAAALVWSIVGKVDIVAVAPGRIVVSERTKTVQPLEAGVVKRVLVKDGDSVAAGQVLVELDATNASADGANVQEQLAVAKSELRRTAALLGALGRDRSPTLASSSSTSADDKAQLEAEWSDIQARLAKLDAEHQRKQAEIVTVRELIKKLDATLPIVRQREADFKSLTAQGFMSGHAGQDRTRERIEQESDLATQQARLAEARASLRESARSRSAYLAEIHHGLNDRQAQARSKLEQLGQERSKAEQRTRLTQLTAPVAGTVQEVAVNTRGGVVTPAQVLMIVVPGNAELSAEVVIDNKDIGFVNAGQPAQIKLETFPFTRYGTVPATVKNVTADAVNDEKRGATFPALLVMVQTGIKVEGKEVRLSPGMNVTAEITTGRRRVIEYLVSPVEQAMTESLKER